jgi:hypothetical protein
MSSAWTSDEVNRLGRTTEIQLASQRPDGSLRPFATIWVVKVDDNLFVRSAHGWDNGWFQRALRSGQGRVRTGGIERDVAFEQPGPEAAGNITAAYHAKYDRYGPAIVGTVVSSEAVRSTLRLVPR